MQNKRDTLVCFTASFPFGLKETFFENELPFLASRFEKVILIPVINYSGDGVARSVPSNVEYLQPTVPHSKLNRIVRGLLNMSPINLYLKDFHRGKVYKSKTRLTNWFNSLLLFRLLYKRFRSLIIRLKLSPENTVLYSYWGEAPLFATGLVESYRKVVRMHRVDFYEEVNDGYLPLRKTIYAAADLLLPISDDIKERLVNFYGVNRKDIFVARLGVDNKQNPKSTEEGNNPMLIRIVSCSRVDPVKRVKLILDALSDYNGKGMIEWHHFGDGQLYNELKISVAQVTAANKNISIHLHGWTRQEDLFHFYENNHVDCFVNVSESEGIPVSIMEAMSYGIPVIATDVGASREIVNNRNGFLLDVDFDLDDLLKDILQLKGNEDKRTMAYETWKNEYQASENYNLLVEQLQRIANERI